MEFPPISQKDDFPGQDLPTDMSKDFARGCIIVQRPCIFYFEALQEQMSFVRVKLFGCIIDLWCINDRWITVAEALQQWGGSESVPPVYPAAPDLLSVCTSL
jgi:hypothetical protein